MENNSLIVLSDDSTSTIKDEYNKPSTSNNDDPKPKKRKRNKSTKKQEQDPDFVCISSDSDEPETKKIKEDNSVNNKRKQTNKKTAKSSIKSDDSTSKKSGPSRSRGKNKNDTAKEVKPAKSSQKNDKRASNKTARNKINTKIKFEWIEEALLSEKEKLSENITRSFIKLFEEGNTIPFIARYRRHLIGDLTPENIRDVKESYDDILELKSKVNTVLNSIEKSGKLTSELKNSVLSCKSMEELEHIYAAYKPASKKSLAERAKNLGLGEVAEKILNGGKKVNIDYLVNPCGPEGLRTSEEVEKNIVHILSHIVAHNTDLLAFVRDLKDSSNIQIATKISSEAKKNIKDDNVMKFDQYFDATFDIRRLQSHQVLAINRGESLKVLSVQVVIPKYTFTRFQYFCERKWLRNNQSSLFFQEIWKNVYSKSISPLISRKVRAELKAKSHKEAVVFFAKNLQKLLLQTPVKGTVIMGLDPGLKQGCKLALISPNGDVLDTGVIYPHTKFGNNGAETIKNLLQKHNCSLVAIGNGKACRETETWLSNLIKKKYFQPLDVSYTIVDESGASVYSCSGEAKKEFPTYDPLVISAISLARRVQDPLAELVKIDPKSLGVGMYQHDISQKLLDNTLNEVISQCVSFVGVDLNTASLCLLKHISGLTSQRAQNIINYRLEHGSFTNRFQLKDVKSIGEKTFEQCAGFLRITPSKEEAAKFYDRPDTTPLDATDVHPEAYDIVQRLLKKLGLYYKQIGQPRFIENFKNKIAQMSVSKMASDYETSEQTIKLIIDTLSRPLAYDLRSENKHGPIFRQNVLTLSDVREGCVLTGRVQNVVAFGAFVDIGVERSGLIHKSKMNGLEVYLGQLVGVTVLQVERNSNKISLALNSILS